MRPELIVLAFVVGLTTWAFRFVPTKLPLSRSGANGPLQRFLAATGPAAIATLFTASVLPMISPEISEDLPLILGTVAVLAAYAMRPSVVLPTLAGALAFGLGTFLFG